MYQSHCTTKNTRRFMLQKRLLPQQFDTQQTQILRPDSKASFITDVANLSFQTNDKRQIFLRARISKPAFSARGLAGGMRRG